MKRRKFIKLLGCAGLLFAHACSKCRGRTFRQCGRLSLPDPIAFNGESYWLSSSLHPKPHYYKQAYLPPGQASERFQQIVLIEESYGRPISTTRWRPRPA